MTNSVNSVTIYLPSLPYLPRLSVFLVLLWLRERDVIAVLTFRNFLHPIWLVHNEKLHVLYSSSNIVRVIISRRIRWAGHVARMGKVEVHTGFQWRDLKEKATWKT